MGHSEKAKNTAPPAALAIVAGLLDRNAQIRAVRIFVNETFLATYGPRVFSGKLTDGEVVELENTSPAVARFLSHGWIEDHRVWPSLVNITRWTAWGYFMNKLVSFVDLTAVNLGKPVPLFLATKHETFMPFNSTRTLTSYTF